MSTWSCAACTYENPAESTLCGMCATARQGKGGGEATYTDGGDGGEQQKRRLDEDWICESCTFLNPPHNASCGMCDVGVPSKRLSMAGAGGEAAEAIPHVESGIVPTVDDGDEEALPLNEVSGRGDVFIHNMHSFKGSPVAAVARRQGQA
jgi:hypothetical protein